MCADNCLSHVRNNIVLTRNTRSEVALKISNARQYRARWYPLLSRWSRLFHSSRLPWERPLARYWACLRWRAVTRQHWNGEPRKRLPWRLDAAGGQFTHTTRRRRWVGTRKMAGRKDGGGTVNMTSACPSCNEDKLTRPWPLSGGKVYFFAIGLAVFMPRRTTVMNQFKVSKTVILA